MLKSEEIDVLGVIKRNARNFSADNAAGIVIVGDHIKIFYQ